MNRAIALFVLIALLPILAFISVCIVINDGFPIIFRQKRVGRNLKDFDLFKFRTMYENNSALKITLQNDSRVTSFGKLLRKLKLDELLQLINIINGTMNWVGPRPEVRKYLAWYSKDAVESYKSIKPGITDLSSIFFIDEKKHLKSYKNKNHEQIYRDFIIPKKEELIIRYVNKKNIFYDFKIIILTFITLLSPRRYFWKNN